VGWIAGTNWIADAPVPMTDSADGLPYASIGIPGRDMGLKLLLDKEADGRGVVVAIPYKVVGTGADGQPVEDVYQPVDLHAGDAKVSQGLDLSIGVTDFGQFTLLDRQARPGPGPRVDRLCAAHRRDHHHVLPAPPTGLDAARAGREPGHRLALGSVCGRRA